MPLRSMSTAFVLLSGNGSSGRVQDRKSTRLNSSHGYISYAVFCLKKKKLLSDHPELAWPALRRARRQVVIPNQATFSPASCHSTLLTMSTHHSRSPLRMRVAYQSP